MYQRHDVHGYFKMIFIQKVKEFIEFAIEQEAYQTINQIKCPCAKFWMAPYLDVAIMKLHLYKQGFWPNHYE